MRGVCERDERRGTSARIRRGVESVHFRRRVRAGQNVFGRNAGDADIRGCEKGRRRKRVRDTDRKIVGVARAARRREDDVVLERMSRWGERRVREESDGGFEFIFIFLRKK